MGGVWHDEGEEEVLDYLEARRRKWSGERWQEACDRHRVELLAAMVAILLRHGRLF